MPCCFHELRLRPIDHAGRVGTVGPGYNYIRYIPGIYHMTSLNVPEQCLFLSESTYAPFILFLAGTMSLGQTGPAVPGGMTKTERFVCT